MPRVPRDNESATPKKRSRKAATAKNGNGIHAQNGDGAVESPIIVSPQAASDKQVTPNLEEQVRLRAYHFYLQRGGRGGSPEQDWFRALEEIRSRHDVA